MSESLLIGETIIFKSGYTERKGLVMGLVTMKFQETDMFATSGLNVLVGENGELENVPYWKVKGIIEPDIAFLELLAKNGDLIAIQFPKYYKPEHPKGWDVNSGNGNNDLPFS